MAGHCTRKGTGRVRETNHILRQRVADGIRAKIVSGEYPVGSAIPSTPNLAKEYEVSKTPARDAVKELQDEGILEGVPGKGVYVKAMPAAAAAEKHDIETLRRRLDELERLVEERVGQFEADLMEIYGKSGLTYQDRRTRHG